MGASIRSLTTCACPHNVAAAVGWLARPLAKENGQQKRQLFTCTAMSMPTERPVAQMISMRNLLFHAILAAERGGNEVRAVKESGDLGTRSKSICYNPVTLGDMRAHLAMKGTLKQAFPSVTVISEEDDHCLNSVAVQLDSENPLEPVIPPRAFQALVPSDEIVSVHDVTVWIDPLDATQEYTEGLYEYVTSMVGIAVKGKPVAGVIHLPFPVGETYWAWSGHGLCPSLRFLEGEGTGLSVSPTGTDRDLSVLRLAMSKNPFRAGTILSYARKAFQNQPFELVPMGGAGYKFIQLLRGNVDGYLHVTKNIKKWDVCAGEAIVRAMQGRVTGLNGEEVNYDEPVHYKRDSAINTGFIAAVRNHESLIASCRRAG